MQSRPERTEAAFSSNTTWAGRTRSLQQPDVMLQPSHSPHPHPGLCLGEAAWPNWALQGPSLVNPASWPRRAGRNSHWEQLRREPQGGCARPRPRPSSCSGGRACPPTGAFLSLRSGPDPGEKRTAPAFLQPGSRVPALPPREGSCPPTCCPSLACTCPCLQRQRSPRIPVHPGRLCTVPMCAGTWAAGASPPPCPGQPGAGGHKEPKAHNTWLGTQRAGGPVSPQLFLPHAASAARTQTSPTLPELPAHKGRRPA